MCALMSLSFIVGIANFNADPRARIAASNSFVKCRLEFYIDATLSDATLELSGWILLIVASS